MECIGSSEQWEKFVLLGRVADDLWLGLAGNKGSLIQIRKKVDFTSFFARFAGSNVLIQCMPTITHRLSNQAFC